MAWHALDFCDITDVTCGHCSGARSYTPIILSLSNHSEHVRGSPNAKRMWCFVNFREKMEGESNEAHKLYRRTGLQAYIAFLLHQLHIWRDGFWLPIPGRKGLVLIQPRLALILGDIVQIRQMACLSSSWSLHFPMKNSNAVDVAVKEVVKTKGQLNEIRYSASLIDEIFEVTPAATVRNVHTHFIVKYSNTFPVFKCLFQYSGIFACILTRVCQCVLVCRTIVCCSRLQAKISFPSEYMLASIGITAAEAASETSENMFTVSRTSARENFARENSYQRASENKKLGAVRATQKAYGYHPFMLPAVELEQYATVTGKHVGLTTTKRIPADCLHLVSCDGLTSLAA